MRTQARSLCALCMVVAAIGCASPEPDQAKLFDVERGDVALVHADGRDMKLNLSHGILFDEALGYASLDSAEPFTPALDDALVRSIAEAELSGERSWSGAEVTSGALARLVERAVVGDELTLLQDNTSGAPAPVCTTTVGKDYTCERCDTQFSTIIICRPTKKASTVIVARARD